MIKPVTFCGTVRINRRIKEFCKKEEIKQIKEYADARNCDLEIVDKTEYKDGKGIYYSYLTESGDTHIYEKIFDFKYPYKSTKKYTQMPPEYY